VIESDGIYKIANGEIVVWQDESGCVCIKTINAHNDPVELAEHEAIELSELLFRLVEQNR